MKRLLVALLAAQLGWGCAYLSGSTTEHRRKHSTLIDSKVEQRPVPDSTSVAVAGIIVDEKLEVSTQHLDQCQITRVQTFGNKEIASFQLPKWHWAILGVGTALSGAGGAVWAFGESKIPAETAAGALTNPITEQDRDLGRTLVPLGMSMVAVGAGFLVSELFDLILLGDEEYPLPDTQTTVAEGLVQCQGRPAPFIEVIAKPAQDPGRRRVTHVTMDTNAEGRASIKLLKSGLAHFPYGKPFAQLDCDSCEPSFVHLTAEAGAEIVHQAARKRDIEAWLTEHRGHPSTELLDGQLEQMAAHERALRKVKPMAQVRLVEAHLWDNRLSQAWEAGALCIEAYPKHEGCRRALKEAQGWYLEHLVKVTRKHLKWSDPQRALYTAKRCLEVKPGYGVCSKLKKKALKAWAKGKNGLKYRVQEIAFRQGKSRVISEFKLKKPYDYARVGISIFSNGRPICVDERVARDVVANEVIVHETACPGTLTGVERVVLRVEELTSPNTKAASKGKGGITRVTSRSVESQDPGDGVAPPEENP